MIFLKLKQGNEGCRLQLSLFPSHHPATLVEEPFYLFCVLLMVYEEVRLRSKPLPVPVVALYILAI